MQFVNKDDLLINILTGFADNVDGYDNRQHMARYPKTKNARIKIM